MLTFIVGDRLSHSQNGEGTILRVKLGPKQNLLEVMFDESAGVGQFIDTQSKSIEAVNNVPINRRLLKWRPTNYVAAANRDFSEQQLQFLKDMG